METRFDGGSLGAVLGLGIALIVCSAIGAEALLGSAERHVRSAARCYLRFFEWIQDFAARCWRVAFWGGTYGLFVVWLPWWYIRGHGTIQIHSPFWLSLSHVAVFFPVLLLRLFPEPSAKEVDPKRRRAIKDQRVAALVVFAADVALAVAAIVTLGLEANDHGHAGLTKTMITVLGGGLAGNMLFRASELLAQRED